MRVHQQLRWPTASSTLEDLDGDALLDVDDVYSSHVVDLSETVVDEEGFLAQNNYDPTVQAEQPLAALPDPALIKASRWAATAAPAHGEVRAHLVRRDLGCAREPKIQIAQITIKGASWLEERQTVKCHRLAAPRPPTRWARSW